MSLFQCDKCGCLENTSLTGAYWSKPLLEELPEAITSYRATLGLKDGEAWGSYCSVCNPIWYTPEGNYGVGPRPDDYHRNPNKYKDDGGVWHDKFERCFFRKGLFHTDENGNLSHVETLEDCHGHELESEDLGLPVWPRMEQRLPRPGTPAAAAWVRKMRELLEAGAPRNTDTLDEVWEAAVGEELRREREDMKRRRRSSMMQMASIAGLAAAAGMPRREPPPPREPTEEERRRDAERSAQKMAAAQAKRDRKAAKRRAQVVT